MGTLHKFPGGNRLFDDVAPEDGRVSTPGDGVGGGGGGGGMDDRVKKLEDDMVALKIDIGTIKATMATKEDLHRELRTLSESFNATIREVNGVIRDQTKTFITWLLGAVTIVAVLAGAVTWIGSALMKGAAPH